MPLVPTSGSDRMFRVGRWHILAAVALLAVGATLAVSSLLTDSITFDEVSHLTAGFSVLKTGDFRLAPDHPPLAKMWAAWPLVVAGLRWVPADDYGWRSANTSLTGRRWLYDLNDGERWLPLARGMIVLVLLAVWVTIYGIARRLFGAAAGLLALALAVLSPTLLAHGRLVTTDVPITLCVALVLLTFARLLQRITWLRLLAVAAALGAASVTKMSWPLVLPALVVMGVFALFRRQPIGVSAAARTTARAGDQAAARTDARTGARAGATSTGSAQPARDALQKLFGGSQLASRASRLRAAIMIAVILAVTTWASIWTCYRWRVSMFATPPPGLTAGTAADPATEDLMRLLTKAWARTLSDEHGQPRPGVVPAVLRLAANYSLLPEAYLFGLSWVLENTGDRAAYFCGQVSVNGFRWYFPLAFAIKTPIATMLLIVAGIAALIWLRRGRSGDPVLLVGVLAFLVIYVAYVMSSSFNIGQRHLLPIYPILFVLAGASAAWMTYRPARWLIGATLLWLVVANARIYPQYLGYFNETIGGPANGYRYLADSNFDWGQDLFRLARYVREHPSEHFKVSYFGAADATRYGFPCDLLPSSIDSGSAAYLDGGGTYVISITNWLGVYDDYALAPYWNDSRHAQAYRQAREWLRTAPPGDTAEAQRQRAQVLKEYLPVRWGLFLHNLRQRPPDGRVGWSMFVYHLTAADIDALTEP